MGETTGISWTDHTFSPWEGCFKVSDGCSNCYAEARNERFNAGVHWGPPATSPRLLRSPVYWTQPRKWNRAALAAGKRARVFCSSLSDVFEDHPGVVSDRLRLFALIAETTALDWQLLTKRPENMDRLAPPSWSTKWPDNVWAGTTAEDAEQLARRAPYLRQIPARVRFLSCEPLLEPLDNLTDELLPPCKGCAEHAASTMFEADEVRGHVFPPCTCEAGWQSRIHWVIAGGESGPRARRYLLDWARRIRSDCDDLDVAFFHKQAGDQPFKGYEGSDADPNDASDRVRPVKYAAHHGADPNEWPEDLRVQQFPREALQTVAA